MGLPCSTAACYRRIAKTDEYAPDAIWYTSRSSRVDTETFITQQLGKFHYEVHALALMLEPYERCRTKAIYLYIDGVRVMAARLHFDAGTVKFVTVQYRSVYWRNLFFDTGEFLPTKKSCFLQSFFAQYFQWYQSGEGIYYQNLWPFSLYRSIKPITTDERASFLTRIEIDI